LPTYKITEFVVHFSEIMIDPVDAFLELFFLLKLLASDRQEELSRVQEGLHPQP